MLTRDERNQCIKFQDAIGEIVDVYLDEASQVHGRFRDLEADQ